MFVLSVAAMINEKFRERSAVFDFLALDAAKVSQFVGAVCDVSFVERLEPPQLLLVCRFLVGAFQNLSHEFVRVPLLKLVHLPLWDTVSPKLLQIEVGEKTRRVFFFFYFFIYLFYFLSFLLSFVCGTAAACSQGCGQAVASLLCPEGQGQVLRPRAPLSAASLRQDPLSRPRHSARFVSLSIYHFLSSILFFVCLFVCFFWPLKKYPPFFFPLLGLRLLELAIDLLAALPTRRFFRLFCQDRLLLARLRLRTLDAASGKLVAQLQHFLYFEVDDFSGLPLTPAAVAAGSCVCFVLFFFFVKKIFFY